MRGGGGESGYIENLQQRAGSLKSKVIDNKDTMSETSTISSDMDSSVNYVFTLEMML